VVARTSVAAEHELQVLDVDVVVGERRRLQIVVDIVLQRTEGQRVARRHVLVIKNRDLTITDNITLQYTGDQVGVGRLSDDDFVVCYVVQVCAAQDVLEYGPDPVVLGGANTEPICRRHGEIRQDARPRRRRSGSRRGARVHRLVRRERQYLTEHSPAGAAQQGALRERRLDDAGIESEIDVESGDAAIGAGNVFREGHRRAAEKEVRRERDFVHHSAGRTTRRGMLEEDR
jgi:hypothetical protein